MLMRIVLTRFNLNISTVDAQRPWFGLAMASTIVMHSTLALAAGYWSASIGSLNTSLQKEGYYQKGEAMRLISKQLSLPGGISDEILAAVGNLANVEVRAKCTSSRYF
jgi:hypothetical protein